MELRYKLWLLSVFHSPDPKNLYYWGLNIAHDDPRYKGQLAFSVNYALDAPQMYIRSTNGSGNGIWAKVLHNKGNQSIEGDLNVSQNINAAGDIGIGTENPQAKLDVRGVISATEVKVQILTGADHVFNTSYDLRPLSEVEQFIQENKHLPEVPSEKHMQENGLNMNEFQIKLLQKIEELTLYVIQQEKKNQKLEQDVESLRIALSEK